MAGPTRLDVVEDVVRRELDAQERRALDADTKAGLVLGFAGVLVSVGAGFVWPPLALLARVLGAGAGLAALRTLLIEAPFAPTGPHRSEPAADPERLRWLLVATWEAANDLATAAQRAKVAYLRRAVRMLALAVALTAAGATVETVRQAWR